ncbi:hypothetical protein [Arcobacter sp. CECT 8985]|uniref:hypothetical protein n=1 Tax=Arcobacter sp. CECT 8985 TaxID=1935424 RepID=UPI00100BE73F|nr:hypothetical protein [Arcobacter sp. CECT 8985]RXJ87579.1 hypothetical protein CRU93_03320 [Arcobacter sp. CECT 8985]
MRYILVNLLFFTILFACSGDCMKCHPGLKKSINNKEHIILKQCITCHDKLSNQMSQCGGDCFSCHSQNKLINSDYKAHKQLASCKKCHISKEDFLSFPNNRDSNLIDLLKNK